MTRKTTSPADWIIVHTLAHSFPEDTGSCAGLPVTSPARTLLDLGTVVSQEAVEFALEDALRRGQVSLHRLEGVLARVGGQGVAGSGVLRRLLEERGPGYVPTRSQLEVRMKNILHRCSLARPQRESEIRCPSGRRAFIDFAYPEFKLGIVVDGYDAHSGLDAWRGDMRRENELKQLGWVVLNFTWDDVCRRPHVVVAAIRAVLAGRASLF